MSATNERDQAITILHKSLSELSILYRQCFDSMGKGALLVYTTNVSESKIPNEFDYRTKEEMLNIFDAPNSQADLTKMIDRYDPLQEGVLALITSSSNATFFITVKLKPNNIDN